MHTYLITPHAPLLLRKGKSTRGERADDSFLFPLPGTVAGMLRTAWADAQNKSFDEAKEQACGGHLLARIEKGDVKSLFPKPADAYYAKEGESGKRLCRLSPGRIVNGGGCDLPDGLLPLFLPNDAGESKPVDGPEWWTEETMRHWLSGKTDMAVDKLGSKPLPTDTRAHVKMDANTYSGVKGHLFRSTGVDLMNQKKENERGWQEHRYALLARFAQDISPGLVRLGSGGRLSSLEQSGVWPKMPEDLAKELEKAKRIRLILVTPAVFKNGWLPDDIDANSPESPIHGVKFKLKLKLKAAAIPRWQPLAGWDMAEKKYKPTRRMVPAGSVYWLEIEGDPPPGWAATLWLASICAEAKDAANGFGLVLPGLWD